MQYIVQHPEELQQIHHSSGIKIGNFRYQPNKTLITDNEKSYDIYENRVVLGFLLFLLHEIERIQKELSDIISQVPQKLIETDGYVTSSYFIYAKTLEAVKVLLNDVEKLHRKFTSLYYLYAKVLPIKPENCLQSHALQHCFAQFLNITKSTIVQLHGLAKVYLLFVKSNLCFRLLRSAPYMKFMF